MAGPECYSLATVLDKLQMPRATFFKLRKRGLIPCLEECRPRLGRRVRYRADLIDRWLAGQWQTLRAQQTRRVG